LNYVQYISEQRSVRFGAYG